MQFALIKRLFVGSLAVFLLHLPSGDVEARKKKNQQQIASQHAMYRSIAHAAVNAFTGEPGPIHPLKFHLKVGKKYVHLGNNEKSPVDTVLNSMKDMNIIQEKSDDSIDRGSNFPNAEMLIQQAWPSKH